jgi:pilus assembly protein CpaF
LAGVFEGAGGKIARLEILTGALSGRLVEVERGEFWMGAAPGNQFVISNDATVSSRHAYLIFEDPILILVDNRSTNGTRVNGKMLRDARQALHDGDQIQIGQTLLRLRSLG